jgi:hypothetical protein
MPLFLSVKEDTTSCGCRPCPSGAAAEGQQGRCRTAVRDELWRTTRNATAACDLARRTLHAPSAGINVKRRIAFALRQARLSILTACGRPCGGAGARGGEGRASKNWDYPRLRYVAGGPTLSEPRLLSIGCASSLESMGRAQLPCEVLTHRKRGLYCAPFKVKGDFEAALQFDGASICVILESLSPDLCRRGSFFKNSNR